MKSLKKYSLNLPEEQYHEYPAWSYSLISRYAKDGFSAIDTLHDKFEATPSMEFGSLFDSIITRGKKTLDDYVVDDTICPPAEKSVFDYLIGEGHTESFDDLLSETVIQAMDACSFYPKFKTETRLDKLDKASKYYNVRRTGKKIVSKQDWEDAMEMYSAFRNDPYLKKLFGTKNTEDIEYIYQAQFNVPFVVANETVDIKAMLDLLVVNHKDKTIQPVDLKTSSMPAYEFAENFLKFHYYLQAELYTDVLRRVCEQDEQYKDYAILPYLFTDISRTDKVPVTYSYDPSNGFSYSRGEKTYMYKGWKELLAEILVYEHNQAKVPSNITISGPNDIIDILSNSKI